MLNHVAYTVASVTTIHKKLKFAKILLGIGKLQVSYNITGINTIDLMQLGIPSSINLI